VRRGVHRFQHRGGARNLHCSNGILPINSVSSGGVAGALAIEGWSIGMSWHI
jgi:hypothetical protein